jgi:hypothetical protein
MLAWCGRRWCSLLALGVLVTAFAACGGDGTTTPTPTPLSTPVPPVTHVATSIGFVDSLPPRGGVIHTGLPTNHNSGVTTGLRMTFLAVSDVDREVRFQLTIAGQRNGVCLTNGAFGGVPAAPVVQMRAGIPVEITVSELLLTSVCRYPSTVDLGTVSLMPASRSDPDQRPFFRAQLPARYTIVE